MTRPTRFLFPMIVFLLIIAIGTSLLFETLRGAFLANAVINGVIFACLLIGILHSFRTVTLLSFEVNWIESFRRQSEGGMVIVTKAPRLMASAATMLGERNARTGQLRLSPTAMQTLLDGVATRLDESREISRYFIGLLVFLGLLGTFWGLLDTVQNIGSVIANLNVGGENISEAFEGLKSGLQTPLAGMGTAFSSSLFGLGGSLVLGFLALQSGQAQNRFYTDLEDWLSSLTRLSGNNVVSDGDTSVPVYIQALLEQTADSLGQLQRTIAQMENERSGSQNNILSLVGKLDTLADSMKLEQSLMPKLAENQNELKQILSRLVEVQSDATGQDVSQKHIKNIDNLMRQLVEDSRRGRAESIQEIRSEIRLLARLIASATE